VGDQVNVAVAVTVLIAAVGAAWQLWVHQRSDPGLRVRARMFVVPGQLREGASQNAWIEVLQLVEVEARNCGGSNVSIEEWRFLSRGGVVIYPRSPSRPGDEVAVPSCPVPCDAAAHCGGHRWYVRADWLWSECAENERRTGKPIRFEDLRACVRRGGDGRWVRARRWGVADEDAPGDEPRATALHDCWSRYVGQWQGWLKSCQGWVGYWGRQREINRPVKAHLNPARIPIRDAAPASPPFPVMTPGQSMADLVAWSAAECPERCRVGLKATVSHR